MNIPFIDSFLFNGEEIVKMRLDYLYEYVDYFYIVESAFTFSGIKKKNYYIDEYAEWFKPYLNKIKFVKIDSLFVLHDTTFDNGNQRCFYEEKQQRNYIRNVLLNDFVNKDFILALCDVDEFYDISKLEGKSQLFKILSDTYMLLKMKMYMYSFQYFMNDNWEMAFIINSEMLKLYEDLDAIRIFKLGEKTLRRDNGWHFTNFMKPIDIVRKLSSFSHIDLNIPPYNNIEYINFTKERGIDLLNRKDINIKKIEFDDKFHNYPEIFQKYKDTI